MKKYFFILWVFGFSCLYGQEKKQQFEDIAAELRCPTCTGLSVLDSDASFSVQIKDLVKQKMKEGQPKEEILSFFVQRYGPWILRSPPKKGFNLLAWLLPLGFLLLGPVFVWWKFWKTQAASSSGFQLRSRESILEQMHTQLNSRREKK